MPPSPDAPGIASLIADYEPSLAAELRAARSKLHALFPRGYELVSDNYNGLVFAITPSERTPDCCSPSSHIPVG